MTDGDDRTRILLTRAYSPTSLEVCTGVLEAPAYSAARWLYFVCTEMT
jgi:hypothetical protein